MFIGKNSLALARTQLPDLKHEARNKQKERNMSNQTGARFKEIYRPGCFYYGGSMYRATSNGTIVNIQRQNNNSYTFKTMRKVTQEQWDEFFEKKQLWEPGFRDRSGIIAGFARGDY